MDEMCEPGDLPAHLQGTKSIVKRGTIFLTAMNAGKRAET